jgi:hypothetical protein
MKLGLIALSALLATAVAFAPGCTSGDSGSSGPGPVAFAAEAPSDGASVFLREQTDPLKLNRFTVDVVVRGAADVHGAAFRVTWDPEALAFVEAASGAAWSKSSLALAKEGTPGQLAVAWTEKGETGIDASNETVIGTLTFEARGPKGSALAFKTERSQLVDKKGARVAVAWRGGSIAAR